MNEIILPTAYLPPVHYLYLILNADKILIEQQEYFVKQSCRNRCSIYTANGPLHLSIPLMKQGDKEPTRDKKISYTENWQTIHWRSISSAYRSSPYFEYLEADFQPFYNKRYTFLLDLNMELLNLLLKLFQIPKTTELTAEYLKTYPGGNDFRQAFKPGNTPDNSSFPLYYQVFSNRHGFIPGLSCIDLLFHEGKYASDFLG